MDLDQQTILSIDKARMHGSSPEDVHAALEQAGHDADQVFLEYARTPFADGRLRGEVNLGDPAEWNV